MPTVSYAQIRAIRAETNSKLYATAKGSRWDLECVDDTNKTVESHISSTDAEVADFETNILPLCNRPIEVQEVRFATHDYSDKTDWDGRTHGDQVAYLAGGVMKHPVDGSWLDATGAAMIAAYGGYPNADHAGDPNYLFGAYAHRITNVYDDVHYKWTSPDGSTRIVWLDLSMSPPAWKDDNDVVVVHYDTNVHDWIRNDTSAVVTSSLWRILPYTGYKIQINKIKSQFDSTVEFSGTLHYEVYMDLSENMAGAGYPAGNYKVADWAYKSLTEIMAGADADPYVEPATRTGHSGPVVTLTFDYKNATKAPIIDSNVGMHLDIRLSDNVPVTNTLGAGATFICLKIRSF